MSDFQNVGTRTETILHIVFMLQVDRARFHAGEAGTTSVAEEEEEEH